MNRRIQISSKVVNYFTSFAMKITLQKPQNLGHFQFMIDSYQISFIYSAFQDTGAVFYSA